MPTTATPRRGPGGPAPTGGAPGRRAAGRRRGQSLVELAVTLPLLLLLMLGTLDLGQMFFGYIQVRNAVREGAAYGSRHPDEPGDVRDKVLAHNIPVGTRVDLYFEPSGDCATVDGEGTYTVRAEWIFRPITLSFFERLGLGAVEMDASATMRCMT